MRSRFIQLAQKIALVQNSGGSPALLLDGGSVPMRDSSLQFVHSGLKIALYIYQCITADGIRVTQLLRKFPHSNRCIGRIALRRHLVQTGL